MQGIVDYIFPFRCVNCKRILSDKQVPVCQKCYFELPFTHDKLDNQGYLYGVLSKKVELEAVSTLLRYKSGNISSKLIRANKYFNQTHIGVFLAELATPQLINHSFDILISVPSHKRTLRKRGYNQVVSFGETLSQNLNIEFNPSLIKRIKRKSSQTHRNKTERKKSLENAFQVSPEIKNYHNILLLDDVITTGSTIISCGNAIKSIRRESRLFVYAMAHVD